MAFFLFVTTVLLFGISVNEVLALSEKPETLFRARDKVVELLLSDPSSPLILHAAQVIYSKLEILKSANSSPEIHIANLIVKGDLNEFYDSLSASDVKRLPDKFDLVFNLLPISRDYSDFFDRISNSDYTGAVKLFSKLKFIYKIPNFETFLPKEKISSLWSFFSQAIETSPEIFDADAAKFVASISTPYDVNNLSMKTYVWLSGLDAYQAQNGIKTVDFETMISSFAHVKTDPNLLQWKYIVSKYLSLYTSITDTTRQLSDAKDLSPFVRYATNFYRSTQNFPSQYRKGLSKILGTYLTLLLNRVSTTEFVIPKGIINDMRKLASSNPENPNSSKLLAIALSSHSVSSSAEKEKKVSVSNISPWIYVFVVLIGLTFSSFIPRVRLAVYRIFKFNKLELGFYMKKLSKSPEDFRWHMKIAKVYEKIGHYEEAQKEYSVAMKLIGTRR